MADVAYHRSSASPVEGLSTYVGFGVIPSQPGSGHTRGTADVGVMYANGDVNARASKSLNQSNGRNHTMDGLYARLSPEELKGLAFDLVMNKINAGPYNADIKGYGIEYTPNKELQVAMRKNTTESNFGNSNSKDYTINYSPEAVKGLTIGGNQNVVRDDWGNVQKGLAANVAYRGRYGTLAGNYGVTKAEGRPDDVRYNVNYNYKW